MPRQLLNMAEDVSSRFSHLTTLLRRATLQCSSSTHMQGFESEPYAESKVPSNRSSLEERDSMRTCLAQEKSG